MQSLTHPSTPIHRINVSGGNFRALGKLDGYGIPSTKSLRYCLMSYHFGRSMRQDKLQHEGQTVYNFVWPLEASVAQLGKVKETIVIVEKTIHDYFFISGIQPGHILPIVFGPLCSLRICPWRYREEISPTVFGQESTFGCMQNEVP
jgi:hypothetical protein